MARLPAAAASTPGERAAALRAEILRAERAAARIRLTYGCWALGVVGASMLLSFLSTHRTGWSLSDSLAAAGTVVGTILLALGVAAEGRYRRRFLEQLTTTLSRLSPVARAETLARLTNDRRGSRDAAVSRIIRQLAVSSEGGSAPGRDRGSDSSRGRAPYAPTRRRR